MVTETKKRPVEPMAWVFIALFGGLIAIAVLVYGTAMLITGERDPQLALCIQSPGQEYEAVAYHTGMSRKAYCQMIQRMADQ